jgi:Questin oxidase-like
MNGDHRNSGTALDSASGGTLDEALERLHATGPEFRGWLSNHGPMAVEAMVRHGFAPRVHPWLDAYVRRLEELPRAESRIDPRRWREALGDSGLLGEWLEFFRIELAERPWREVLATWWPRLLPGIAAGATHGVIRTGHAVRVLVSEGENGPRRAELGQALGYWAARWQPVPGVTAPAGPQAAIEALDRVPPVPDQSGGIVHRLEQLGDVPAWPVSLAALRPARTPDEVPERLAEVADAAAIRFLSHGHGNGTMQVHSVTAPTAVLRTLPALPKELWTDSLHAAWAASAAVTAAYEPAGPAPAAEIERLLGEVTTPEDALARAAAHGDEHVIKLADAAVDVHTRTGAPAALAAAIRATELITP